MILKKVMLDIGNHIHPKSNRNMMSRITIIIKTMTNGFNGIRIFIMRSFDTFIHHKISTSPNHYMLDIFGISRLMFVIFVFNPTLIYIGTYVFLRLEVHRLSWKKYKWFPLIRALVRILKVPVRKKNRH